MERASLARSSRFCNLIRNQLRPFGVSSCGKKSHKTVLVIEDSNLIFLRHLLAFLCGLLAEWYCLLVFVLE